MLQLKPLSKHSKTPIYMKARNPLRGYLALFVLFLSGVYCGKMQGEVLTWSGSASGPPVSSAWSNTANWQGGVLPSGTATVVFGHATSNGGPGLGSDRTVANFLMSGSGQNVIVGLTGSLTVTNDLIATSGASTTLTLRGANSVSIGNNFTVASVVNFGSTGVSDANSQFGAVFVGGTTDISSILNLTNPTSTVNLGNLVMRSSGTLNMTVGTSQGTFSNSTNLISVSSLSGTGGVIRAGKASTTGHLNVNGSTNGTYAGTIINGSGTVRLTKAGSGTLTLTGTNTYTGTTAISQGTLLLSGSGSINGTSGIALSGGSLIQNSAVALSAPITWTGGTIGGSSTITGNLVASGTGAKALNPGNSPGQLLVTGDVTLDTYTVLNLEINSATAISGYDVLALTGALALNNATLNVILGYTPLMDQVYTIATFGNSPLLGTFNGLANGSTFLSGGQLFEITYNANDITLQAVPEPSTVSLAVLSLAGLMVICLRRKKPVSDS